MTVAAIFALAGLAAVHLIVPYLRFLRAIPRSRWLSAAGGASVAYVFLHLFPELAAAQAEHRAQNPKLALAERHLYGVALIGLAVFYGLERFIRGRRGDAKRAGVFWLHLGSFAAYDLLIGYLLVHQEEQGPGGLALYAAAIGLHFLTNDFGLRQDHRERYDRTARWLLAAATIIGGGLGISVAFAPAIQHMLFAFLAGGIVLNVLKEELPEEREGRFAAFAIGAGGYGALLLVGA